MAADGSSECGTTVRPEEGLGALLSFVLVKRSSIVAAPRQRRSARGGPHRGCDSAALPKTGSQVRKLEGGAPPSDQAAARRWRRATAARAAASRSRGAGRGSSAPTAVLTWKVAAGPG